MPAEIGISTLQIERNKTKFKTAYHSSIPDIFASTIPWAESSTSSWS